MHRGKELAVDYTRRLRSVGPVFHSECIAAGFGPLRVYLYRGPDDKVQFAELVLLAGSENQFAVTAFGPFKNDELAELSVYRKAILDGVVEGASLGLLMGFLSAPSIALTHHRGSPSRKPFKPLSKVETIYWTDDDEVDELISSDDDEMNSSTAYSRRPSICSIPEISRIQSHTNNMKHIDQLPRRVFPPQLDHWPVNFYAPPLRSSYGPRTPRERTPSLAEDDTVNAYIPELPRPNACHQL